MAYTLYAALVPSYLQILRGAGAWLDEAAAFARENDKPEMEMIEAKLAPDTLPFYRQLRGFAMHAQGGIEGATNGVVITRPQPRSTDVCGAQGAARGGSRFSRVSWPHRLRRSDRQADAA